jgi:hypothetical protein
MEPAPRQAMLDRPPAETKIEQLSPGDNSVLFIRQSPNTSAGILHISRSFD